LPLLFLPPVYLHLFRSRQLKVLSECVYIYFFWGGWYNPPFSELGRLEFNMTYKVGIAFV
jgi:hypothetical protein